jgi:hypothetical protein
MSKIETTTTTPKSNKKSAPRRAAEANAISEANKAGETETTEASDGKAARKEAFNRDQEKMRKLPAAKRHALKVRNTIDRFRKTNEWLTKLPEAADVDKTGLLADLASAAKLIASVADQLDELPDDAIPVKKKGGGGAKAGVDVGAKVVLREKHAEIYTGRITTADVMEIKAYRKGYAEVTHASGVTMFLPRKHLQLADEAGLQEAAE